VERRELSLLADIEHLTNFVRRFVTRTSNRIAERICVLACNETLAVTPLARSGRLGSTVKNAPRQCNELPFYSGSPRVDEDVGNLERLVIHNGKKRWEPDTPLIYSREFE